MKNGVKNGILLLAALGTACSLVVAPASADDSPAGRTPITITVEDEARRYQEDNPAAWSCRITEGALVGDDSIEDLVNGPPFCAANKNSKAGVYPITLTGKEEAGSYDVTIVNGTLTIEPAVLTSFSPDELYAEAYYLSIYASDPYNKSAASLLRLLSEKKGVYKADCGGGAVDLKAAWRAGESGAAFDPKGSEKTEWGYIWYSYTADLTAKNRSDAENYEIALEKPKAYVRVIPVNAVQALTPNSATLTAAAAASLTNEGGMRDALNLPETAAVTYIPSEAAGPYNGEANGEYAISGWELEGGRKLTLKALQDIAAGVAGGQETAVTLTPVYAAAGEKAVPDWATLEEAPRFTLTITGKTPLAAAVQAPGSITYGETLGDPVLEPEIDSGIGTVAYRYLGVDGTKYDSTEKPAAAGSYRVAASLTSASHSGSWTSEKFTIRPRPVTVTGIRGTAREYDGTTNANAALYTEKAVIHGMLDGDDLHAAASGYFVDKNAGREKTVVIIQIALTGEDAGNYILSPVGNQAGTTASITPKPLELDDSGITISKQYDGTKAAGTLEGRLKLKGVINSKVSLSEAGVKVGPYGDSRPGENKTVTLYGLRLAGSAAKNYALAGTHTFTRAEITAKPRPVLNRDFTVTIPQAAYDGRPHGAAVAAADGAAGLGAAAVAYARQRPDGTYDAPAAGEPVNAGAYKVIVSFEEGAGFAAMRDRNAVDAGTLTIKKASAAAAATVTVPVTAAERTMRLSALDLPAGMAQGAKIKEVSAAAGEVLKAVTGEAGGTAFTLKTKTVSGDRSQDFRLVLGSDNYARLTVTVTVLAAATGIEITPPAATVRKDVFEYGTPLGDIISLEGGSAALNGTRVPGVFTLPDELYDAGRYTDVTVLFHSSDGNYQNVPVKVSAAFTIRRAAVTALDPGEPPVRYLTIYANDPSNISAEGLKNLVAAKAGTYTASYGGGTVQLKAGWRAVSTARPYHFDPRGKAENVWYPYTAALTTAKDSDAKNFQIDIDPPMAYARVIPVGAAQTLTPDSAVLTAAAVKSLTNETMKTALGLPEKAGVTYEPMEELPSSELEETSGAWAISGWKMNGRPLTLKALQAKAAGVSKRNAEITLTPVYASNAIPAWATVMDPPVFHLTITGKAPAR